MIGNNSLAGDNCENNLTHSQKGLNYYELISFVAIFLACVSGFIHNAALSLVIIALIACLILRPEYLFGPLIVFTSYDEHMLAFSGISFSQVCVIFILLGVFINVYRKKRIKNESAALMIIILLVMGIVLSYYSIFGIVGFPKTYFANLLLTIALMLYIPHNLKRIFDSFHIYCEIVIIYAVIMVLGKGSIMYESRLDIEGVNSNAFAMSLAAVCTLLFLKIIQTKEHRVIRLIIVFIGYVCILFSGSRSALVAALLTTIILFVILSGNNKARMIFLFLISAVLLYFVFTRMQSLFPGIMSRYTVEDVLSDGGTYREDVWENYFNNYFSEYWLYGIGFDSVNVNYASFLAFGSRAGAHNILVQILASTGVLGLILYGAGFLKYLSRAFRSLKTNNYVAISITMVLTAVVNGIGENTLGSRFLWLGVGLGYMIMNNKEQLIEKKQEIIK